MAEQKFESKQSVHRDCTLVVTGLSFYQTSYLSEREEQGEQPSGKEAKLQSQNEYYMF